MSFKLSTSFAFRRKKSKHKEGLIEQELELERRKVEKAISGDDDRSIPGNGSGRKTPVVASSSSGGSRRTEAEKRFEERQKQRVSNLLLSVTALYSCFQMAQRVAKLAGKTHKDRVNEFNAKLEALSEHHDIPKVHMQKLVSPFFLTHYLGWTRLRTWALLNLCVCLLYPSLSSVLPSRCIHVCYMDKNTSFVGYTGPALVSSD